VGTDIPHSIPVVGAWVTQLLRGGEDVTGDTLTRFFGIHVCILPIFFFLFLAIHVYLIQKKGMSVPLEAEMKDIHVPTIPFWPNFVYREMIVWLVLVGILFSMAILLPPSLDKQADLMAAAPEGVKPEWYFLFLFQTLKIVPAKIFFMNGDTVAVLLMLLAVLFIFFLPVIDNKPAERKGKIITILGYAVVVYALIFSVWSLL
jgi:cytochrome b6